MGTGGDIGSGGSLSSCFLSWSQCLGLICNFLKSDCVTSSSGDTDAAAVSRNVPHRNFSSMTGWHVATNSTTKSKTRDVLSSAFPWLYDCRRRCRDGSSRFLNLTQPLWWRLEDSRSNFGPVMTPERLAQCSCRTTNTPYVEMQLLQQKKLAFYHSIFIERWNRANLWLTLTWEFLEVGEVEGWAQISLWAAALTV
jgi:hypothetical protein